MHVVSVEYLVLYLNITCECMSRYCTPTFHSFWGHFHTKTPVSPPRHFRDSHNAPCSQHDIWLQSQITQEETSQAADSNLEIFWGIWKECDLSKLDKPPEIGFNTCLLIPSIESAKQKAHYMDLDPSRWLKNFLVDDKQLPDSCDFPISGLHGRAWMYMPETMRVIQI